MRPVDGVNTYLIGQNTALEREVNLVGRHGRSAVRRFLAAFFALMLLVSGTGVRGAHAQEGAAADLSPEGQAVLAAINARRAEAGLSALIDKPRLNQAAQSHANDVLYNNNYSHWGTDGTLVEDRVARTGYSTSPWVSENWVSASSVSGAMAWWMNDYIHRVNILTARWRDVGVGVAIDGASGEMIFVTVFSVGPSGTPGEPVVAAASAAVDPEPTAYTPPEDPSRHIVQAGDTLLGIAIRYDQDMDEIAKLNHLIPGDFLQIGQVLLMPGYAADGEPVIGGVGGPASMPTRDYAVSSGETLFSIAAANDMTWQDLASMNGMGEHSLLQIGQVIQLPLNESSAPVEGAMAMFARPSGSPVLAAVAPDGDARSVVEGYSLPDDGKDVAGSDGQSEEEPVVTAADAAVAAPDNSGDADEPQYHIITAGDTVIGIAQRYGMAWGELLALNGLDDDSILEPGMLLRLR